MSYCPAYANQICSLCCALETRCNDQCRPTAHFSAQLEQLLRPRLPEKIYHYCVGSIGQFFLGFIFITTIVLGIFYLSYLPLLSADFITKDAALQTPITSFFLMLVLLGVIVWLFVLAQKSTRMALQETNLQTQKLSKEISAHKVTLQKLEYARKTADSANVAKSDYVTALSHELRTPLNVLLGYAQLLQEDHEIPEPQRDKLSILRNNGEHLATMIEGLLEISKIEAGKLNLNRDEVRLDLMLEQMIKMFRYQAECKGLTFDYSCPPNLPSTIKVDEKRLRQILINLLSNAIKFTERGGINFSVTYRGHVAHFNVSDTGYGISAEHLKNVFIPFERGALTGERQIPGSGLGLAICRQLADMMGADIEVNSTEGLGSTFTLLLQVSPIKSALVDTDNTHSISGYRGERKTILSIDDNQDHRQLLANFLLPLGFTVLEAHDNTSSQAMMSDDVDLVLLDIRLGREPGWDIAKSLRSQYDRLPIVMVSANARGFHNKITSQRIYDDYLEKPVQLHALLDKIGHLLNLEWLQKENLRFNCAQENKYDDNNKAENAESISTTEAKTAEIGATEVRKITVGEEYKSFAITDRHLHQLIGYARTGNVNAFLDILSSIANRSGTNKKQDHQRQKGKDGQYINEEFIIQLKSLASEFKFESIVNLLTSLTSSTSKNTGDPHD